MKDNWTEPPVAQAAEALEKMNGSELLGQTISVDWAFVKSEKSAKAKGRR